MRRLIFLFVIFFSILTYPSDNRFISLAPSITEIFFAIEAQDSLIGVISPNDYPEEAKSKEVVASYNAIDFEKIVALKVKECFTLKGMQNKEDLLKLEQLKIKVTVFDIKSIEDLCETIIHIGNKTDRREKASSVVQNLKKEIDAIKRKQINFKGVFLVGLDPPIYVGRDSFLNEVMEIAGIKNAFEMITFPYFTESIETLIKLKPQVVIIPSGEIEERVKTEYKKSLKSFLSGIRFIEVEASLLLRPSPRIIEGIKKIVKDLYEEKN